MKLVNPLYYPLAVLAGGISLFFGVRLLQLPSLFMLPVASGITIIGASLIKSREPSTFELANPELEREVNAVKLAALGLVNQSENLRSEAKKLLTDSFQIEILTAVEINCDRTATLPNKIDTLAGNLYGNTSILSVSSLQQQLVEVQQKLSASSGVAKEHLSQLAASLKRNLKLAQDGEDTRLARIINISTLIQDCTGILQQLQTKLRSSDLSDSQQINEMQSLSDELTSLLENLDLLVRK
ncbi:hypothetical protein NIES21_07580 [Anabaenopsis circularis NIES-21]|uniref:Uncharacterized protein n=2 Tax=Nostocales TaxID=1161 RepID=A0A1Z4GBW3_9CYAN|nr:hypothetical protein [Nostoc cycadae]BAY14972.1 hypothetical protein NIES21_07580 [Anabaenopsis circularis NIES-21]GBE91596.1 hypothetical protein NCWK1_1321 [Nostoc cycadae WK-1]